MPQYTNWERCRINKYYSSIENNTITLVDPWNSGTIPAGTKVANFMGGAVESYPFSWGTSFTTIGEWIHYEKDIVLSDIRFSTAYTYFGLIWYAPCNVRITNIKLTNISRLQTIDSVVNLGDQHIDKKYIAQSNEFVE